NLTPTAEAVWAPLLADGKTVVAATFPGADGANITVPGLANSPIIQPAPERTVSYTVPFGEFGGVGGAGFTLAAADFTTLGPCDSFSGPLGAAGHPAFNVAQKTTPLEAFVVGGVSYTIQAAALDTTSDSTVNYDTIVFYDNAHGGIAGPF